MSQDKNAEEWNDFGHLLLRETAKKRGMKTVLMADIQRQCTERQQAPATQDAEAAAFTMFKHCRRRQTASSTCCRASRTTLYWHTM